MKIHLLSDLHLEINSDLKLVKPNDANGLILAGDIGDPESMNYKDLLKQASELYQWVVVVRGNHEAYGYNNITDASEKIGKACAPYSNVHYLQNDSLDLEGDIRIIGATLWSDIQDYQRSDIGAYISDYYKIKEWSIEHNNYEHFKDLKFIKSEIDKAKQDNKRLVVATHHAPYTTNTSKPEYRFSPLSSAFATDLSNLFELPIVAWVYGHTHYCNYQIINGVHLISNQHGYSDENTGFDPLFTFDV